MFTADLIKIIPPQKLKKEHQNASNKRLILIYYMVNN